MLIKLVDHLPELEDIMDSFNSSVMIGIQLDSSRDSEISNSELAYIHEYGAPHANIPARPFFFTGVDRANDSNLRIAEITLKKIYNFQNVDIEESYQEIGENTVNSIQNMIQVQNLVDTGQMIDSITYIIE